MNQKQTRYHVHRSTVQSELTNLSKSKNLVYSHDEIVGIKKKKNPVFIFLPLLEFSYNRLCLKVP